MKFSLKQIMLLVALLCVSCGLINNVYRHWVFLGEMTGNYTRIETHAYYMGVQGMMAGLLLSIIVAATLKGLGTLYQGQSES